MKTQNILNKFNRHKRPQILSFITHERYQSNMDLINADFYMLNLSRGKSWNKHYAPWPKNHYLLPEDKIPEYLMFDFVLSQSKYAHYELAKNISSNREIPLVCLEHTLPTSNFSKDQINQLKSLRGDVNIYISEYNKKQWGDEDGIVINHCVNCDIFKNNNEKVRKNHILTVQNDYINRNYCLNFDLYSQVTEGLLTFPVGDTPGLSKAAEDIDELIDFYQTSRIYLNTAHESPIPSSLLEAMACGCACVSIKTCAIPEYIEHGVNGFLCSSADEMRYYLEKLIEDEDLCKKIGNEASKTIAKKCDKNLYTEKWNNLIGEIV